VYSKWLSKGLTRAHIRDLDRPLYQALAKWLERHSAPPELEKFLEPRGRRRSKDVDEELAKHKIFEPTDAFKRFPNDRRTAERLYQAALRRLQLRS
jgi:hypothetical protein